MVVFSFYGSHISMREYQLIKLFLLLLEVIILIVMIIMEDPFESNFVFPNCNKRII